MTRDSGLLFLGHPVGPGTSSNYTERDTVSTINTIYTVIVVGMLLLC